MAQVNTGNERVAAGIVPPEHTIWLPSRRVFFLLLGLLFTAHIGVRLWITPIAELDESWQVVLAQHWSFGYHAHPPLYTWLQIICFKLFGESIFTLALLKNALLFGLYAFTYGSARLLTRRHDLAVFAALTLMLIPQISWESQRDLTHSVLLSTTMAATLFCFLWLAEAPSAGRHALFGLAVGLTLLSKYNAGVFLLGGAIAALLVPRYRAVLLDRRSLVAAAICLLVAGPHFVWICRHAHDAFARTDKLDFRPDTSYGDVIPRVLRRVLNAALPNLIPMFSVYVLARLPAWMGSTRRREWFSFRNDTARLIFWGSVISVLLLTAGMIVSKATTVRGRWFQPMFVCGPIFVIAQIASVPRWLYRMAAALALAAVITVIILLPINVRGGGSKSQDLTAATVSNIVAEAGGTLREADVIITDDFWLGGNMRLSFGKPVAAPDADLPLPRNARRIVAVFERTVKDEPRKAFKDFLNRYLGEPASMRIVHLTPNVDPRRTGMRVGVAVIER